MFGNKLGGGHFAGRLNASISAIDFTDYSNDPTIIQTYFGTDWLKEILENSLIMTGQECFEYAKNIGLSAKKLELINDVYGQYADEKQKDLKPNFKIAYKSLDETLTLKDCVTIRFHGVQLEIEQSKIIQYSIYDLADLFIKAGLKSLKESDKQENFELHIFRVKTSNDWFYKLNYDKIPQIEKDAQSKLIEEIKSIEMSGPKMIYFYNDKWDFHFSNFNLVE